MQIGRIIVYLFVLGLSSFSQIPLYANDAFHAEGILNQYSGTNLDATFIFTISVDQCRWLIRIVPEGTPIAYYEDGCESGQTYYYTQIRAKPGGALITATATIESNNIPYINSPYMTAVWLAYGSSCYFDGVKGDTVKPFLDWGEPDPKLENIPVKVDWKRFDQTPFAPSYVYSKEMGRCYTVNAVTNYNGLLIPVDFVLENYPNQLTNSVPTFSLRGKLGFITNNTLVDFRPRIKDQTYIEDKRFEAASEPVASLYYVETNVNWLSARSTRLLAIYHEQRSLQPAKSSAHTPSRFLVLILLACPTIVFVVFAIFRWKHTRNNTREKGI